MTTMTTTLARHRAPLTVHAVPPGSSLTAYCGEELNGTTHTGRYPILGAVVADADEHACAACNSVLSAVLPPRAGRHLPLRVVDDSHRHDVPTGRVLLTCPAGTFNSELVAAAGYDENRHLGYTLTRHDDAMATVALWND